MRAFVIVCYIIKINGFVLRDTYKLVSKDSANYKVDMVIDEDDYEMIDNNRLNALGVNKEQFDDLDKIARIEYSKSRTLKLDMSSYRDMSTTTRPMLIVTNSVNDVVLATYLQYAQIHGRGVQKRNVGTEGSIYNYNELINEYHGQVDKEAVWQDISDNNGHYDIGNALKDIFLSRHCVNYSNKSIGFQAIKSLVGDYNRQQKPTKDVVTQLWWIIKVWFVVYLTVAVPLWCTKGWCCCCLVCNFFTPRRTIDAAKKYLIVNPPGVFKTKTREIYYEPTEREKEAYEEVEHFIKTL